MAETFLALGGVRAIACRLVVPEAGSWFAEVKLDSVLELEGKVTLELGELACVGTIDPQESGSFQASSIARIVGGLGWRKNVKARHFHIDVPGVRASIVASATAAEIGETMGTNPTTHLGPDFLRRAAPAARVLERIFSTWWVDFAGVTHGSASSRPSSEVSGDYELLEFNPQSKTAVLAVDEPGVIAIGSILRKRLDAPLVARSVTYHVQKGRFRVSVWGEELAA